MEINKKQRRKGGKARGQKAGEIIKHQQCQHASRPCACACSGQKRRLQSRTKGRPHKKSLQHPAAEQGTPTITSLLFYEVITKQLTFCHLGLFSLEARSNDARDHFCFVCSLCELGPRGSVEFATRCCIQIEEEEKTILNMLIAIYKHCHEPKLRVRRSCQNVFW